MIIKRYCLAFAILRFISIFSAAFHEPANYTGSYTTASKEIVDTEIEICQGAEKSIGTAE
jgi:hypothetical protein